MSKRLNQSVFMPGLVALFLLAVTNAARSEDWLQFRGTNGAGVYE